MLSRFSRLNKTGCLGSPSEGEELEILSEFLCAVAVFLQAALQCET